MSKDQLRKGAVKLREKGLTYSEILNEIPVAKSTLSLWLRDVGLAKKQRQKITEKKRRAQLRGAEVKRRQRIKISKKIMEGAKLEIGTLRKREAWLIGIALYWAEGDKEKLYNKCTNSSRVAFANSDPRMINLFLRWLNSFCDIDCRDIITTLYLHENSKDRLEEVKNYWFKRMGLPTNRFDNVYYKKHKPKTNRKNVGQNYYGLVKITVRRSTNLNRRINGWIQGIYENCGVV